MLTFLSAADLWFIISNVNGSAVNWLGFYVLVPEWNFVIPIIFTLGLIGIVMLCMYCIKDIQPDRSDYKEYIAVLLAALGFTYQVIGAWPLWGKAYPWFWQQEIAKYGNLMILPLFIASLLSLIVGAASLYIHSKPHR